MRGIKYMYVDSSASVRVKGGESEWFRIYGGVRQEYIIVPLAVQCIYEWSDEDGDERRGVNFMEDGRESRLPGLLSESQCR